MIDPLNNLSIQLPPSKGLDGEHLFIYHRQTPIYSLFRLESVEQAIPLLRPPEEGFNALVKAWTS